MKNKDKFIIERESKVVKLKDKEMNEIILEIDASLLPSDEFFEQTCIYEWFESNFHDEIQEFYNDIASINCFLKKLDNLDAKLFSKLDNTDKEN